MFENQDNQGGTMRNTMPVKKVGLNTEMFGGSVKQQEAKPQTAPGSGGCFAQQSTQIAK